MGNSSPSLQVTTRYATSPIQGNCSGTSTVNDVKRISTREQNVADSADRVEPILTRRRLILRTLAMSLLASWCALPGCTASVNHFKSFSTAGTAYVDAQKLFLGEAGDAAVNNDSTVL